MCTGIQHGAHVWREPATETERRGEVERGRGREIESERVGTRKRDG